MLAVFPPPFVYATVSKMAILAASLILKWVVVHEARSCMPTAMVVNDHDDGSSGGGGCSRYGHLTPLAPGPSDAWRSVFDNNSLPSPRRQVT